MIISPLMSSIDRRALLKGGVLAGGLSAALLGAPARLLAAAGRGFTHGVASGDPRAADVVLWTRYVPADAGETQLRVELSEDPNFSSIAARATATASPANDHCAKTRVTGLRPGRRYHYRFSAPGGERSVIGRTRTLPQGKLDRYRIAVVNCANATSGWFNAYAHAAARGDIDLVVHLGDYIYESPTDRADAIAELAAARRLQPAGEAVALADYRRRYASYRADPDLAELHRLHPMISVWDDHETANNGWVGGASGHQEAEGSWDARKAAGMRANAEWMPMSGRPYDSYRIGDLATLFRLETRLVGRTKQLDLVEALAFKPDPAAAVRAFREGALADPARSMMGARQEKWLADGLRASASAGTPWQILAQQVIMGPTLLPSTAASWFAPGRTLAADEQYRLRQGIDLAAARIPLSMDRWDGYPAARARLLASAQAADANLVTLSGDSHNAWAYDLVHDGRPAGVEFASQAVSSFGLERRFDGDHARIATEFVGANPDLKWCDTSRRGYMVVELTPTQARCEWLFLPSRTMRSTGVIGTASFATAKGTNRLQPA